SSVFVNAGLGGGLWGGGLPITTDGSSLYVNDVNNTVIRKISSGGVVSTLFGSSTRQYQLDGALGSAGTGPISDSSYTSGIYYGYGKLYILDDRGVRVVQSLGGLQPLELQAAFPLIIPAQALMLGLSKVCVLAQKLG